MDKKNNYAAEKGQKLLADSPERCKQDGEINTPEEKRALQTDEQSGQGLSFIQVCI
jgi:hypothetical protein